MLAGPAWSPAWPPLRWRSPPAAAPTHPPARPRAQRAAPKPRRLPPRPCALRPPSPGPVVTLPPAANRPQTIHSSCTRAATRRSPSAHRRGATRSTARVTTALGMTPCSTRRPASRLERSYTWNSSSPPPTHCGSLPPTPSRLKDGGRSPSARRFRRWLRAACDGSDPWGHRRVPRRKGLCHQPVVRRQRRLRDHDHRVGARPFGPTRWQMSHVAEPRNQRSAPVTSISSCSRAGTLRSVMAVWLLSPLTTPPNEVATTQQGVPRPTPRRPQSRWLVACVRIPPGAPQHDGSPQEGCRGAPSALPVFLGSQVPW